jgi:hypothetical protein
MEEREFWGRLEYRLCREFEGMPEKWQRHYWCDGFEPETYEVKNRPPRITGFVWMADGDNQSKWAFRLLLPQRYDAADEIDWAGLLPPENVTRWLAIDPNRRVIEIEPAAAVLDRP